MKITFFLIAALALSPKIEEVGNTLPFEQKANNLLCSAVVEYITNNNPGSTVLSVGISGCSSSSLTTLNLSSGTTSSLNQTTCAYKTVRLKIAGEFNTVKMYDGNGNMLESQDYDGPLNIFFTFATPECGLVHFIID